MVQRLATPLPGSRVGIVESDQPLALRAMQGERVVDAMRLLRRHRHQRHDEPDPVPAVGIHHEHLPVKVEKNIEGRVTRSRHYR
jgi:hypothetical protein